MKTMMKLKFQKGVIAIIFLMLCLVLPGSKTQAVQLMQGESVTHDQSQITEGTLLITGQNVTVSGEVNGDVICAGQSVQVNAAVHGDVICAGQTVNVSGEVDGSVRVAAQTLTVNGVILRNLTAVSQTFNMQNATLAGELWIAGNSLNVEGDVGGDVLAAANTLNITGSTVNGSIQSVVNNLNIDRNTSIAGNINYTSENDIKVAEGATISGTIKKQQPEKTTSRNRDDNIWQKSQRHWTSGIPMLVFTMGLALLGVFLWPDIFRKANQKLGKYPLRAFVYGAVALFVTPFVALMLVVTIIGIPFAVLGLIIWIIMVSLSRILIAGYIGQKIVNNLVKDYRSNLVLEVPVGLAAIWLFGMIPLIGWLVSMMVLIYGAGIIILLLERKRN